MDKDSASILITNMIEHLVEKAQSYLSEASDGSLHYVDPNEGREISAHYGGSHLAAALILYGKYTHNDELTKIGCRLLRSLLDTFERDSQLPAYHFDFNNFAFALVVDSIDDLDLQNQVCSTLLMSKDSDHSTVNWLPMRIFVNSIRERLSNGNGGSKYRKRIELYQSMILDAINVDGSIEDRLPYGVSFNLQYDIATLALLHLLNQYGFEFKTSESFGFLINCMAPDGDINYQGRGANQVFAWGPWIYLLVSAKQQDVLEKALKYFSSHLPSMLNHDSMMLNDWDGSEKYLWWDYHYASVYIAHCLLWLVLSVVQNGKEILKPKQTAMKSCGIDIYRSNRVFVAVSQGRKEYLAETGPAVCAVYDGEIPLIKGTFGPWRGLFGNNNTIEIVSILNYCGLYRVNTPRQGIFSRIKRKIGLGAVNFSFKIEPIFRPIDVEIKDKQVIYITWHNDETKCWPVMLNVPMLNKAVKMNLTVDGQSVSLFNTQKLRNQYGWVYMYQTRVHMGAVWTLSICLSQTV